MMPNDKPRELRAFAGDRKPGMTLDELTAFVTAALRADTPGADRVGARVGWTGQLTEIWIRPQR